jgi:hypothetical protein
MYTYTGNTAIEQFDINDLKSLNDSFLDEKMHEKKDENENLNENEILKNSNLKLHFFKKIINLQDQLPYPDIRINDKVHIDNNIKKLNLNDIQIKAIKRYALHIKIQPPYKTFNIYPLAKYLILYKHFIVIIMLCTFTLIILSTIIMSIYQVFSPDIDLQGSINIYSHI